MALKFLSRFHTEGGQSFVFQVLRQREILKGAHPVRLCLFFFDIAFVLNAGFDVLKPVWWCVLECCSKGGVAINKGGQFDVGSGDQLAPSCFLVYGGAVVLMEKWVDFFW